MASPPIPPASTCSKTARTCPETFSHIEPASRSSLVSPTQTMGRRPALTARAVIFGETDEAVAKKTARAVSAGLLPIVCVGETKEERDAGSMWEKVSGQVRAVFEQVDAGGIGGEAIVFAYEPVWAIGTGETATP